MSTLQLLSHARSICTTERGEGGREGGLPSLFPTGVRERWSFIPCLHSYLLTRMDR